MKAIKCKDKTTGKTVMAYHIDESGAAHNKENTLCIGCIGVDLIPIEQNYYQLLFDLLYNEHGLTLLDSEMKDIIYVVEKMQEPTYNLMRSIIDKMLNISKPSYSEAELLIIKDSIDRHMSK
jgi:hypothetical protein